MTVTGDGPGIVLGDSVALVPPASAPKLKQGTVLFAEDFLSPPAGYRP